MLDGPIESRFSPGTIVAGRLRVVRCLGIGGMGAVYEVEHEITRHRRALKLLHAQMAEIPGVVERFLREASAAGRIGNPHIVETFDAGLLESGEPYIVMELLQGKSLAELLNSVGHLDITTTCDLMIQICDGVAAAHAAGIVHRDLKPENLFLTGPNDAFLKILDFGISKFDATITGVEGITLEGSPLGTPFYMSPEQVMGRKTVDVRTDVYALGVVLYECLTAKKPFDADNLPQLAYLISQGKYPQPSELRPTLPKVLDAIVAKAMALDPAHRYASASDLGQIILGLRGSIAPPAMVGEPLASAPPSIGPASMESRRSAPALTPDVFSKSTSQLAQFSQSRRSRRGLWTAVGVVTLGVAVLAAFLGRSAFQSTESVPSTSALRTESSIGAASAMASDVVRVVPVAGTTPDPAMSTAATDGLPPVSSGTRAPPKANAPTKSPKSAESANAPNRAAAVGLSVDNPFK